MFHYLSLLSLLWQVLKQQMTSSPRLLGLRQHLLLSCRRIMTDEPELLSSPKSPQFWCQRHRRGWKSSANKGRREKQTFQGRVEGLFGGFRPLMCNPVTLSGLLLLLRGHARSNFLRICDIRQRALQSEQVAERKTVSLCLKRSNGAIYTSGGLKIGLHYIFNYREW